MIGFPDPGPITQGSSDVDYFILADDAFTLKTWFMKPYGRMMLTRDERIANYRITRSRRVVENAFGILVSWWPLFNYPQKQSGMCSWPVWFCTTYWEASIKGNIVFNSLDDADDVPGDCQLIGGAAGGGLDRNPDREAKRQRDYYIDYVNDDGAVAWQDVLAEYNCYCSNQSFSGLPNIPRVINQVCLFQISQLFPNIQPTPNKQTNAVVNIIYPPIKQTNPT